MRRFLLVQMHQMLLRGVTPPSYSPGPSRTGLGESGIHPVAEKASSRKPGFRQILFSETRGIKAQFFCTKFASCDALFTPAFTRAFGSRVAARGRGTRPESRRVA